MVGVSVKFSANMHSEIVASQALSAYDGWDDCTDISAAARL